MVCFLCIENSDKSPTHFRFRRQIISNHRQLLLLNCITAATNTILTLSSWPCPICFSNCSKCTCLFAILSILIEDTHNFSNLFSWSVNKESCTLYKPEAMLTVIDELDLLFFDSHNPYPGGFYPAARHSLDIQPAELFMRASSCQATAQFRDKTFYVYYLTQTSFIKKVPRLSDP